MKSLLNGRTVSKFRPTTEQIVKGIKLTKQTSNKINAKHDGAVNYLMFGLFFALLSQIVLPQENNFYTFDIGNDSVSVFFVVYSIVSWVAIKTKIWK